MNQIESVEALSLSINNQMVAILTHYSGGKNCISLDLI